MARLIGRWRDNAWHWTDASDEKAARAAQPRVYVATDRMANLMHPVTGQHLDSKSAFRAATKASGCVEIGNDNIGRKGPAKLSSVERKQDIVSAHQKHEWNN